MDTGAQACTSDLESDNIADSKGASFSQIPNLDTAASKVTDEFLEELRRNLSVNMW